jgi:hypothetical protein
MQQLLDEKQRRIDMPEPQRRIEEALRDDVAGSTHEDARDPEAWHAAVRTALSHPPEATEPHPYQDIDYMFSGSARSQASRSRAVDLRMGRSGPSHDPGPSRSHGYGL